MILFLIIFLIFALYLLIREVKKNGDNINLGVKQKSNQTINIQPYVPTEKDKLFDEFNTFNEKNREIVDKWLGYENKIPILYSTAINQPTIYNNYTDKCINLCLEYINFYPEYMKYAKKYQEYEKKLYGQSSECHCSAVETLAKLYERQEEYIKAILVCISGIIMEYGDNFEDNIYFARIGRLVKKHNKKNVDNQIEFDYDTLEIKESNGK